MGASLAAIVLPTWLREALAAPAKTATGTLDDVEHIVIFTQENRSLTAGA
ncbi:hypothetical protein [Burkholderia sp. SRS-W-2-2016]|nr:hypothetical protein [Burkholderia sp. SRS-W-2-2016]